MHRHLIDTSRQQGDRIGEEPRVQRGRKEGLSAEVRLRLGPAPRYRLATPGIDPGRARKLRRNRPLRSSSHDEPGAYDWTMDLLSWTWGGLVDLNQKHWAARVGYFLLPVESSTNYFDTLLVRHGQYTGEVDLRYRLYDQPGKLQLFGWISHGNIGSYGDALAQPRTTPGFPNVTLTRGRERYNWGFVVSVEQALAADLGVFSRRLLPR